MEKFLKSNILKRMIIIPTIIFALLTGVVPTKSYAAKAGDSLPANILQAIGQNIGNIIGANWSLRGEVEAGLPGLPGNLLKEFIIFFMSIGDVIVALLQVTLVGDYNFWFSTMVTNKNDNLDENMNPDSPLSLRNLKEGAPEVIIADKGLNSTLTGGGSYEVPIFIYSPENIFTNKIAALDANFINPHTYRPVSDSEEAEREATSFASIISPTISSWYRAFRNIAIVGLLTVLVYIGIRILIGSGVEEKAKYKERIKDWLIAFCLVFFMHYIMAGIMMFTERVVDLFDQAVNLDIAVYVTDGCSFKTNLFGYTRFCAQSNYWKEALGYGIMYLIMIGLVIKYTIMYYKRFFYLAFFTMIAPLVALTYPIDKVSDGKAQAFNMWIKEYFINAFIQPIHLVLYSAIVGSALMLAVQSPLYGIIALLFISTAEKWVKKMFKMDKAELTSASLGDMAMAGAIFNLGKKVVGGAADLGKKAALAGVTVATAGAAAPATVPMLAGGAGAGAAGVAGAGAAAGEAGGILGTVEDIGGGLLEGDMTSPEIRGGLETRCWRR